MTKYISLYKKLESQRVWFEKHFKPNNPIHQWTSTQVIHHFISIEKAGLFNFHSNKDKTHPLGFRETFNSLILNTALKLPFSFKAPQKVSNPENTNINTLFDEWKSIRDELESVILDYPSHKHCYSFFKHPKTGLMTLNQYLKFLYFHHNHHKRQFLLS